MTEILAWFNPARWLMALGVIASLLLGYMAWEKHQQNIGETRANARWAIATVQLKKEATDKLDAEKKKVAEVEQRLQDFKNQQEIKDARNQTTVTSLGNRLRMLAGSTGRLRDPNATGCGCSGSGSESQTATTTNNSTDNGAQTSGLLSEQLSDLLFERLREADTINIAYIACRADTESLRLNQEVGSK